MEYKGNELGVLAKIPIRDEFVVPIGDTVKLTRESANRIVYLVNRIYPIVNVTGVQLFNLDAIEIRLNENLGMDVDMDEYGKPYLFIYGNPNTKVTKKELDRLIEALKPIMPQEANGMIKRPYPPFMKSNTLKGLPENAIRGIRGFVGTKNINPLKTLANKNNARKRKSRKAQRKSRK